MSLCFEVKYVKEGNKVHTPHGFVKQTMVSEDNINWFPYQQILNQRYHDLNYLNRHRRSNGKAEAAVAKSAG